MLAKLRNAIYADVQRATKNYDGLGITASFFSFFQGRATAFAIYFTIIGTILVFKHALTANFVAFVGAIQALVVGHSLKEDWFARRNQNQGQ